MPRALFIIILLMFSGCLKEQFVSPTQQTDAIAEAEYAVLSTIVTSALGVPLDSIVVVQDSTNPGTHSADPDDLTALLVHLSQEIPVLESTTIGDYREKNTTRTYVQTPSKIHPGCVRASSTTKHFPAMDVSRVGFNADGQQALAYVGFTIGPLAGAGVCYVLARHNGSWAIIGSSMIWIS
jgi:hypothetical protein